MTRSNTSPSAGKTIVDKLKTYEGGTGQTTAADTRAALGLTAAADLNAVGGIAGLDASGKMAPGQMPNDGPSPISVQGAATVTISASENYQITNFDIFTTYTLVANGGSVVRNGASIVYTAPATPGPCGFSINGRTVSITAAYPSPGTPSIVSPTNGATNQPILGVYFTSSAYVAPVDAAVHASSDWQVASDAGFNNILQQSNNDTVNKTSWSSSALSITTTYYVRVRHRSASGGVSAWSPSYSIVTSSSTLTGTEEAKLVASDVTSGAQLGVSCSMSADGSRVVVAAPSLSNSRGAIYIYVRTGTSWAFEQKILNPLNDSNMNFGHRSVSMSDDGTRLAVGMVNSSGTNSRAYVFVRTGSVWAQEANLQPAVGAFQMFVSISGDGSRCSVAIRNLLNVYVYVRSGSTWSLEQQITPTDAGASEDFGSYSYLCQDGSRMVIGSYSAITGSITTGCVYVYVRSGSTWTQEAKIFPSDPKADATFGYAAALDTTGTRLVVGCQNANGSASNSGALYVFLRTGTSWTQEAKVYGTDLAANGSLGISCSIDGSGSIIAGGARQQESGRGAVYIFSRNGSTWTQLYKTIPSDRAAGDYFGFGCSISRDGSHSCFGSNQATVSGVTLAGAAYVFR